MGDGASAGKQVNENIARRQNIYNFTGNFILTAFIRSS